jgi:repressor LexA
MNMESLSERQKAILKFIREWSDENGYPPTIREIGKAVKINSTSVVNYNLNKLVKEGFIIRTRDKSRGIRLTGTVHAVNVSDNKRNVLNVPMVGQIVAGKPAPIPGDDFGYYFDEDSAIAIPRQLIGTVDPAQIYALKVNGYSMIDAMINDGDTVILKKQETANNGDMVAVWLGERGETTLKHFYDEGEQIRLQPANPMMEPIFIPKEKVQIQGKVLAVLRRIS